MDETADTFSSESCNFKYTRNKISKLFFAVQLHAINGEGTYPPPCMVNKIKEHKYKIDSVSSTVIAAVWLEGYLS